MASLENALSLARAKGVRFWVENGALRYSGPRNALSAEELCKLRAMRQQIISLLAASPQLKRAPLTFTQRAHWNLYEIKSRKARRETPAVLQLQGDLSVEALRHALVEVVRRHEALRTQIVTVGSVPMQEVSSSAQCELEVAELEPLAGQRDNERLQREIENFIATPIDVSTDPLFAAKLLEIAPSEHVLILVTEHLISDGVSLNLLVRDLFLAYQHVLRGEPVTWPAKAASFADYATWQQDTLLQQMRKHSDWNQRLIECGRLRFPRSNTPGEPNTGWTYVCVRLPAATKQALQLWSRSHHTTLVMCIFTAYAVTALRWCNTTKGVFQYVWDGRVSPRDDEMIGNFASMLYVLMEMEEGDTFHDLLRRAVQRYCDAFEHADFGYLEAQSPRPEICRNALFNWIPEETEIGLSAAGSSVETLRCRPMDLDTCLERLANHSERDNEPAAAVQETKEAVIAYFYYSRSLFSREAMERFAAQFSTYIAALLHQPETRLRDLRLP